MEPLQAELQQLVSGLVALVLGATVTFLSMGVRYLARKTGLVDSETMLKAEGLLSATLEANVLAQEQEGKKGKKGEDKARDAISGAVEDLARTAERSGARVARLAREMARDTPSLERRINGLVGKLF